MLKPLILLAVVALSLASYAETPLDAAGEVTPGFQPIAHKTDLYEQYAKDSNGLAATPETIAQQNADVFAQLAKWQARSNARQQSVTPEQAHEILAAAMENYVAGKKFQKGYDPNGNIGFCFGRAMWMHLELLKRGIDKNAVFKAFVVGEQEYENIKWQFHVATIVKSTEGFLVLDPEFMMVTRLEDWFQYNMNLSTDKKLRLYVTDPAKFGASAAKYDRRSLNDGWYNNYFKDMMGFFRDQANRISKTPLGVPEGAGAMAVAGVRAPMCREIFTAVP